MKKEVIVTGAGGQTGQEIYRAVNDAQRDDYHFLQRNEFDISDPGAVLKMLEQYRPAALINCAAYTKVDKAETEHEEAEKINGKAPGILAEACAEVGCRFIHISTDYVFDGNGKKPLLPSDPVNPVNAYGETKLSGERNALEKNPDSLIVRTAWVYSEYGSNFVKTMLRLMQERGSLNVVADQLGSPTYAKDLAQALIKLAEITTAPGGIYHYTNAGICSWHEFAKEIASLGKMNCTVNPIPTTAYPTPAARPKWSVLDTSKISDTFGLNIRDWQAALAECIQRIQQG